MQPLAGLLAALLLPFVAAQNTITTTDDAGQTIVEVIQTDLNGLPTATQIIETITPAAVEPTTTTVDGGGGTSFVEIISVDGGGDTVTNTIRTILPAGGPPGNGGPGNGNGVPGNQATTTTVDAGGGTSYVEVIQNGNTQTIQTITPAADVGVGPVGQPAAGGNAGAPTPYVYTTTDANGNTIAVQATFTPAVATTKPVSLTFKATVLNYSQYLASYATAVQTQNNANADARGAAVGTQASSPWLVSALVCALSGLGILLRA